MVLPIICTTYTGVNDVVQNGINGFVYDASDSKKLEEHIVWFINHREQIFDMSVAARQTALSYSWEITTLELLKQSKNV